MVGIETAAFQHILKQWIDKEKRKRSLFFETIELKPGQRKKTDRIKALQPLFESNSIHLHKNNCEELVVQLLNFPSITKDDHLDCLAYLLDVLEETADIDIRSYMDRSNNDDDPHSLENVLANLDSPHRGRTWKDY